ncbi:TetR/AcrR family transcriptional regulator [Marinagarivorans algicola]|uniref:TetR/AcrR family transcriptional regulator n=1 Tax=Marinagarivorans algicola TaxID=1513270 RepID=UPI0006B94EC1|nr:TetR/AcrR family transcriptional regulator [Marinagarivorans algicola]
MQYLFNRPQIAGHEANMASGRKLTFDKHQALEAAMYVFWKKGYGGASLAELTHSMGINKPSLYAAFGNKEALFVQATDYYAEVIGAKHNAFLTQKDTPLSMRLKLFLTSIIKGQCDKNNPKGCYISLCAAETESEDIPQAAQQKILEVSELTYKALVTLFKEDVEAQHYKLDTQAQHHACFLMATIHGTAAMARAGKSQKALMPVVDHAIEGLGLAL